MARIREFLGYGSGGNGTEEGTERVYDVSENIAAEPEEEKNAEAEVLISGNAAPEESATTEAAQETETGLKSADETEVRPSVGSVEMIVKPEKDLAAKYSKSETALASVVEDGDYLEDYGRAKNASLLGVKDLVLAVVAQDPCRFYAPETPKNADWIDEEYLTERVSSFFSEVKESGKQEQTSELALDLYHYLRKSSHSKEAYAKVDAALRLVARVHSAQIKSSEDADRMRASLARFNASINEALSAVKQKHAASVAAETAKAKKLQASKKELAALIENMSFDF
jgi:hypothetical protein